MDGQLGVLYQGGKQVGGIFDWEISAGMASGARDGWVEVKVAKQITALSYWLISSPQGDIFDAEFYQYMKGRLVLIDTGAVKIKLPEVNIFDKRLAAPLRIIWMKPLSS